MTSTAPIRHSEHANYYRVYLSTPNEILNPQLDEICTANYLTGKTVYEPMQWYVGGAVDLAIFSLHI
jgi:hypothetical protein